MLLKRLNGDNIDTSSKLRHTCATLKKRKILIELEADCGKY